jgi:hypothetical protein
VASFVPTGWLIEQRGDADLNNDGYEDALLLLREDTGAGAGSRESLSPTRIIVVLLGASGGFALAASNSKLIPQVHLSRHEDPLANGEFRARTGSFEIKLALVSVVGSYLSAVMRYRFAYETGCFRLVGYERLETHRATLDTSDLRIDYLTGVVARAAGNASVDAGKAVQTSRLSDPPRRCLEQLGNAAEFVPP